LDPETRLGSIVDDRQLDKVLGYVDLGRQEGATVVAGGARVREDSGGYYIPPTILDGVDNDWRVSREEIFGPVLTVLRADDLDGAIGLANRSEYALTAGIYSRSPANIARAAAELRAGNVYINRHITGAVVGRQPFGGYGMSGVGSKAGGPDYLLQFLDPRVVTENTLRQGFAPDISPT
jgi:RHH-type transcriptional regulator, proline utilization regulon repressor / proline dehydrogenase / delta 1-pyrroline-5-carboxylate dehydrogenase